MRFQRIRGRRGNGRQLLAHYQVFEHGSLVLLVGSWYTTGDVGALEEKPMLVSMDFIFTKYSSSLSLQKQNSFSMDLQNFHLEIKINRYLKKCKTDIYVSRKDIDQELSFISYQIFKLSLLRSKEKVKGTKTVVQNLVFKEQEKQV